MSDTEKYTRREYNEGELYGGSIEKFLSLVGKMDRLQRKYIKRQMEVLREEELFEFSRMIDFFERLGYSMEDIANTYMEYIRYSMEESLYFRRHGSYRHHTVAEVESDVYLNREFMNVYMVGLALAQYLFRSNRECNRLYREFIEGRGGRYLEVGPGHGEQLYCALRYGNFTNSTVIDISPACIDVTRKYIDFRRGDIGDGSVPVEYICRDVLNFSAEGNGYDTIVMSAVLEHLEKPSVFLEKLRSLSRDGAKAYVTASIDLPARDHLYLFSGAEEVLGMARSAGFSVERHVVATYNGQDVGEARKRREPVKVAMILSA